MNGGEMTHDMAESAGISNDMFGRFADRFAVLTEHATRELAIRVADYASYHNATFGEAVDVVDSPALFMTQTAGIAGDFQSAARR